MTRKEDLEGAVTDVLYEPFDTRFGSVVPTTDTLALKNGGVYLDAVYLYADMSDSTGLARLFTAEAAARIIRAYLTAAARTLRSQGGEIRSYDGDRVMAIFIGADAGTRAVRAALEIRWVVDKIVHPALCLWLDEYRESLWVLRHTCGVDMGTAFIVRAGVRNSNDLVSVGDAPNIAAKLSALKGARTFITDRVWDAMGFAVCVDGEGTLMWSLATNKEIGGGRREDVWSSDWGWVVG
jgi:class 3 adenylate cyclase